MDAKEIIRTIRVLHCARDLTRITPKLRSANPNSIGQTAGSAVERLDLTRLAQHLVDLVEVQFLEHDHLARILLQ